MLIDVLISVYAIVFDFIKIFLHVLSVSDYFDIIVFIRFFFNMFFFHEISSNPYPQLQKKIYILSK